MNISNINHLIAKIKEKNPKRILLQLPDGLKTKAIDIISEIEKNDIDVILSGDTCYGACDLRINEAMQMKCDLIVHVGHKEFFRKIKAKIPVLYYEWEIEVQLNETKIKNELKKIKEKKIGLLTTVQYIPYFNKISEILKSLRKKPVVGGEILGCWFENAKKIKNCDAILFFGSGEFHSLGLVNFNKIKKIYFLDLEKNELKDMEREIMLHEKRRFAKIAKARDAKTFGILVSSKPGQLRLEEAEKIKRMLEQRDKKAHILIMDEINDENLLGLKFDYFINTACQRIELPKMINASDIEEIFK